MEKLLLSLQADFDDAEGWIQVVGANWVADDVKLEVSVQHHDGRAPEFWEINCTGVAEDFLTASGGTSLSISTASPLVRSFTEPQVQIMFARNSLRPETLLGVVCSCCVEVMGRAELITRFMNGVASVKGIACSEYGLLGRFPQSLAVRIMESLARLGIEANALPGWTPTKWNGIEHVAYPPLQVMQLGASYVIAEHFSTSLLHHDRVSDSTALR